MFRIYKNNSFIFNNFFWKSFQLLSRQGIIFLTFIFAAQLLNPIDFGAYTYVIALTTFISMFSDFGISAAVSKFVAEYADSDKKQVGIILFNSFISILIFATLASSIFLLAGKYFFPNYFNFIMFTIPLLYFMPLVSLYDGVSTGLKKFKIAALISLFSGIIALILIDFFIKSFGIIGALIVQILLFGLNFFGLLFVYRKQFVVNFDKNILKKIYTYSITIGVVSVSYFFLTRVNTFILAYFGYFVEVGYYELINRFILILILPFQLFSQVISPDITKYFYKNKIDIVLSKYKSYAGITFFAALTIFLVSIFLSPVFIKIVLPAYNTPQFIFVFNIFLISTISQALSSVASIGFGIPTGNAKLNRNILFIFVPINLVVAFLTINYFNFSIFVLCFVLIKVISDISYIYFCYKLIKRQNN
jgi:O-antigen/teichoic acid export membrane protein